MCHIIIGKKYRNNRSNGMQTSKRKGLIISIMTLYSITHITFDKELFGGGNDMITRFKIICIFYSEQYMIKQMRKKGKRLIEQ